MKTIVIYNSQTGFTKRYVQWIAETAGLIEMSAPSKLMMKMFIKALKAQKNKSEEEQQMIKMISTFYDISDKKCIELILECLKE